MVTIGSSCARRQTIQQGTPTPAAEVNRSRDQIRYLGHAWDCPDEQRAQMTRHAKNCTAGAVYTYHEKKKDAQASGYGTQSQRVGKDSVKDFDCCSLTLQPCREPLVS